MINLGMNSMAIPNLYLYEMGWGSFCFINCEVYKKALTVPIHFISV